MNHSSRQFHYSRSASLSIPRRSSGITIETQKGHNYLRCTKKKGPCPQPFVREEEVARQVQSALTRVAVPQCVIDWMLAKLEVAKRNELAAHQEQLTALDEKIAAADAKVERLTPASSNGFRHPDLRAWAKAQRPRLIWAALTLVRLPDQCERARGSPRVLALPLRVCIGAMTRWPAILHRRAVVR